MTISLYLSRVRLRKDAPVAALRGLLVPAGDGARIGAAHRLVWTLFADAPDRQRDFLWRETEDGTYYVLSRREPIDPHDIFDIDEPKLFEPSFSPGDRLGFVLRANATVARGGHGSRGKPCDVVMDALHATPSGQRAEVREQKVQTAGLAWLEAQGRKNGFTLDTADGGKRVRVVSYQTVRLPRERGRQARLGILDFEGVLRVADPQLFPEAIIRGFGRAKAFGYGLMLIRRC